MFNYAEERLEPQAPGTKALHLLYYSEDRGVMSMPELQHILLVQDDPSGLNNIQLERDYDSTKGI